MEITAKERAKVSKDLKRDFSNLMEDFKDITTWANTYNLKEYLELLRELKSEVDYEFNTIEKDIEEQTPSNQ